MVETRHDDVEVECVVTLCDGTKKKEKRKKVGKRMNGCCSRVTSREVGTNHHVRI